jgi:hypothetical protein
MMVLATSYHLYGGVVETFMDYLIVPFWRRTHLHHPARAEDLMAGGRGLQADAVHPD